MHEVSYQMIKYFQMSLLLISLMLVQEVSEPITSLKLFSHSSLKCWQCACLFQALCILFSRGTKDRGV